jgi:hypothetical protein
MLSIDHLAVTAESLEAGAAAVEARLGVPLEAGGRHATMGTHNRLLGLGPGLYLEVIAIDPAAPVPAHPRWFNLDHFAGPARLGAWVARCDRLADALDAAPPGSGEPRDFQRGDFRWQMTVSDDGRLPFDQLFPALMTWGSAAHPADRLPERHCRLVALELFHPDPGALSAALAGLIADPRLRIHRGDEPCLRARIATPHGERLLD